MSKKVCSAHGIAHPTNQGCPYCGPVANVGLISSSAGDRQDRVNLIHSYLALLPLCCGLLNDKSLETMVIVNGLAKKLGYPEVRTMALLSEALAPAQAELAKLHGI